MMAENNKPPAKVVLIGLLFPVILIIALDYTINGEKLWCTNGVKAKVIIVMARTGKKITAFIVEMDRPGVEIIHRSRFMGLKAL